MLRLERGAGFAGRENVVTEQITVSQVHNLRLTVTDVQRSREFYTGLLGFEVVAESPPPGDPAAAETFKVLFGGVGMARGSLVLGLRPMAAPVCWRSCAATRRGRDRTSSVSSKTSWPLILAVPLVGAMKHVRMRIVVDLPAPFGPRKPTISPLSTSKLILSTARNDPKFFVRSFA